MGLLDKLSSLEHHGRTAVGAEDLAPTPNAADFVLTSPAGAVVWTPGEMVDLTWRVAGSISSPLAIALIGPEGPGRVRMALLLAADVDPQSGRQAVEVPAVRAAAGYVLAVSNDDPLVVYGPGVTVIDPA